MKLKDIQSELARLFDGAGEAGGIVVWHDPEGEFADSLGELELPGVEVLEEREYEVFGLKRMLNADLAGRKILLYRRRARKLEGDWLADIEVRSQRFSADYASVQLRELGCPDNADMRAALRARKAFLSRKTSVRKLAALRDAYQTPQQLEVGIMAVALGAAGADGASVLVSFLSRPAEDAAGAADALESAGVRGSFGNAVAAWTGFAGDACDQAALRKHVLLTAFSRTAPAGALTGLETCVSAEHASLCHDVFAAWAALDDSGLAPAVREVEAEVGLEARLEAAGLSDLSRAGVFPCVDAVLLRKLFAAASASGDGVDELLEICARRRGLTWAPLFADCYRGVETAAHMLAFQRAHSEGMGPLPAARVWGEYAGEWYRMDAWYRELHMAFQAALKSADYGLDEDFRGLCGAIEKLYKGWFLHVVNDRWCKAAAADLAERGSVADVPRQRDLYLNVVGPTARAKKRAWVIVSDALRYEVAAELSGVLERETKGSCELSSVQAVLPSVTKCGMAAVLPSGSYAFAPRADGKGFSVLLDGEEAPGTAARQEAIRRTHPQGVAVSYDDFMGEMGRAERKQLVDAADVVYIFHNTIDALGDKRPTERKVFQGCADAIGELAAAVKLVVREFGASDVCVTADHGFLYTDQPLAEPEHASLADMAGEAVEAGRRYVVAREGAESDLFLRAALPGTDGLVGFFPRECVRIRMAGGGENYVHGGVSIQEMCVPVLRFSNHRAGSKGYVEAAPATISLVSTLEVISNSLFTLEFLQDEPVGGKVLPREYDVFVADAAHAPVSDVVRVVAASASPEARERTTSASFGLRAGFQPASDATYLLLAKDTQTGQAAVLRELRIQIAFTAPVDFGW